MTGSPLPRRFGGLRLRTVTVVSAAAALALTGTGIAVAFDHRARHNQVGQNTGKGLVVSDDQVLKPLGQRLQTQFGKFMGSTVSPDGRFLAATSTDKSVVLQIFDLKTYKLIWTVGSASAINQTLADGTVGQVGPDVLAGRQVPLAPGAGRPDPVPGQRRRHPRYAGPLPAPDGGHPPVG